MELEIAALLTVKGSKKSDKPEKVKDALIPSQMESVANPAKSDPEIGLGKSDPEIDNPNSNPDKSGSDANKSEPDESNVELEKMKAIAEKVW